MCRAPGGSDSPHDGDCSEVAAAGACVGVVDPLVTNLRHFHPETGSFCALPQGEFVVVKRIAPGIHGDVFECRWTQDGADDAGDHVAVKRLRLEALLPRPAEEGEVEYDERRAHLRIGACRAPCLEDPWTEIGVLQYLSRQTDLPRYLLRMHDIFQDHCHAWLVTEFADGGELFDAVSERGPLPEVQAKRYIWELLQAVGYLHKHYIGHRDISLENILLKDGAVRLMDFGMAVKSQTACGTPLRYFRAVGKDFYRAPECYVPKTDFANIKVPAGAAPGSVISATVGGSYVVNVLLPAVANADEVHTVKLYGYEALPMDIFSTGVCLFIMLNGVPAWNHASLKDNRFAYAVKHDVVELQRALRLGSPSPELSSLMKGMMSVDPAKRWGADACMHSSWLAELAAEEVPVHHPVHVPTGPFVRRITACA